jgi:hypothetical protein
MITTLVAKSDIIDRSLSSFSAPHPKSNFWLNPNPSRKKDPHNFGITHDTYAFGPLSKRDATVRQEHTNMEIVSG